MVSSGPSSAFFPQDVAIGTHIRSVSSSSPSSSSNTYNPLHPIDEFALFQNATTTTTTTTTVPMSTQSPVFNNNNNNNATTQQQQQQQQQQSDTILMQNQASWDPTTIALTIISPILLVVIFVLCTRGSVPGREHWRGEQIREAARRIRQARMIKKQRLDMTPEERQVQIQTNMRTMTVVGKDIHTGHLRLNCIGQFNIELDDDNTNIEHQHQQQEQEKQWIHDTTIKTLPTEDTEDIVLVENDSENDSDSDCDDCAMTNNNDNNDNNNNTNSIFRNPNNNNNNNNINIKDDDRSTTAKTDIMPLHSKGSEDTADTLHGSSPIAEEEEDVCHICLDTFEIGDVVMWSRRQRRSRSSSKRQSKLPVGCCKDRDDYDTTPLGCRHVFHQECLMPWLMEKRENECPSCRSPFILDKPNIDTSMTIEESINTNTEHSHHEGVEVDHDGTIQVIMGDGSRTTINETDTVDIEAPVVKNTSSDETNTDDDDDDDDDTMNSIEEGYSYVIAKGLIQKVPNRYGSLAGPVPFRPMSKQSLQIQK
ncbi:ring finger domain containing protein [Nitzschia inconspicua]|uniref:Ring finger domain containing protein n=1 Tax=Nitzschia inconspicua TaxID=303405 RepID=A0A9K3KCW1_9STRA|nr:ring finger domain containing protein [Nitzschia inconspicua]KAG7367816.1 ring finger domain containing protein [Nitzschia inconspicua]